MTRPRITAAELQERLERAREIPDRRKALQKARHAIRALEFRSALGSGERIRVQSR